MTESTKSIEMLARTPDSEGLESVKDDSESVTSTGKPPKTKWLVLSAAFCITFVAVGMANSFGVFQDYYQTVLFPQRPSSEIILIGSLASSLYMILGAFTGRLADFVGYPTAASVGSAFMIGGLFAASAASQFFEFVLFQGLLFGLGSSFAYYPAVSVSRRYFQRHGLANGFVLSGGALGGCVLPYSVRVLLEKYGLPVAFRTLGYIAIGLLTYASLVFWYVEKLRPSQPKTTNPQDRKGSWKQLLDLTLLGDTRFLAILVAGTIAMTGFLPRFFLVTPSAIDRGIDPGYAAWLLGIMNGLSIVGRLAIGSFADKHGKLTALVLSFVLCGIGHLAFWLPAVSIEGNDTRTLALLTTFVVFVGLFGSGFVSLIPVVMADLFGSENLASKVGLLNSVMGLGVFAGPSAVYAIVAGGQHWSMAVMVSGLLMVVGGLMLLPTFRFL